MSVEAQPRPAGGDAGVVTTGDAGATARPTDGGSATPACDGGVTAPVAESSDGGAANVPTVPTTRRRTELKPPTPQQKAALEAMQKETDVYAEAAREYKESITSIITLHYEEKKKSILTGLDREIKTEQAELKKAREIAIDRLEKFIAKYSGANANKEATPDAMYRLAALYEERARLAEDVQSAEDVARRLGPAINMYKQIIREYPQYRELAGVYYFLGHALNDVTWPLKDAKGDPINDEYGNPKNFSRAGEAQQVWRALVCKNHFQYPVPQDKDNPEVDQVLPLPQDHDQDYWRKWRGRYPKPSDYLAAAKRGVEDTKFVDPFPQDCTSVPQPSLNADSGPKYIAEAWMRIANYEFDQWDLGGGVVAGDLNFAVWDYNRAARAYQHAMDIKKPQQVFAVSLYKYAWTLFKQQRFEAATKEFIHLLNFADELQRQTGDQGADLRKEAYEYIAGSLTQPDFPGPGAEEPYIAREDIIAIAANQQKPELAEEKFRIGIQRVQNPEIIPQTKPWTIKIYQALATEYKNLKHFTSAIAVYKEVLKKWPLDPDAPDAQNGIAQAYEELAAQTTVGDARTNYEKEVINARTALAKYVGATEWVDANKDNPAALQHAEELVRVGLKSAAGAHTLAARVAEDAAAVKSSAGDTNGAIQELARARSEFKLAAIGWRGYLNQDPEAPDAYETKYFYAEALHEAVFIQFKLHQAAPQKFGSPADEDMEVDGKTTKLMPEAKRAAIDVRDSDEDDTSLDDSAYFVVDLSDIQRDLSVPVAHGDSPRQEGPEGSRVVVVEELPPAVLASMAARDEYVQRVPANLDKHNRALLYQFYSANSYYVYGHFKEARERFEPMYKTHCGKDEFGYEAWKRLIIMANWSHDADRSRELAEAAKSHSCAKTPVQIADEPNLINPTLQRASYEKADKKFKEAEASTDPAKKKALYKEAAGLYEAALQAAPEDDDAPTAAMNGAFSYKQFGDSDDAIRLYDTFISKYGNDTILDTLKNGGPNPKDPKGPRLAPNPEKYKERLKFLGLAFDNLARTYYEFFSYPRAAAAYQRIAQNQRFDDADGIKRRQRAGNLAMILYANLSDKKGLDTMYTLMSSDPKIKLTGDKLAEAEFMVRNYDYGQWNPSGTDSAANGDARRTAQASLMRFYQSHLQRPDSARFVVEAAFKIGKMMKTAGEGGYRTWFRNTVDAWKYFNTHPTEGPDKDGKIVAIATAQQSPYNDFAAEADFTLADEDVHNDWDYSTNHHKFTGGVKEVVAKYDKEFAEANTKWLPRFNDVQHYNSKDWIAAAMARSGSLYDSLRQGLDLAVPELFTPAEEQLLQQLEASGQAGQEQAAKARDAVENKWRSKKENNLKDLSQRMVAFYASAAFVARKANVKNDAVRNGVNRLAFYTNYFINKDADMNKYVEATDDPFDSTKKLVYTNGMFLQWRAGITQHPSATAPGAGTPVPRPLVVQ